MVTARLYSRPTGLPESIPWCGWCATAYAKGLGHKCPASGKPPAPPDHPGLAKVSKYRATPTHVDGIRFASKTEAGLYEYAKASEGVVIVPHVRYPLHVLTSPGLPASWFTPDLTLFISVPDTAADGSVVDFGLVVVEAWEAKGAKACESRDYQLRARAFVRSYPSIRLRVFRKVGGEFVEDSNAAGAAGGGE